MSDNTTASIQETNATPIRWKHPNTIAFLAVHVLSLGVLWTGVTPTAIWLFLITFWVRMFGVTGGYHRYFSHRTYKTSRPFQFILALLATSSAQKGVMWWASHHRVHHRYSDTIKDPHSPWYGGGFFWSHMGWIMSEKWEGTDNELVKDLGKYPEIRWLEENKFLTPMLLGIACYLIGGFPGLFWGFFLSTTLLFHGTFTINSFSHRFGTQRYKTTDTSRNNWFFAILTLGEGWHNNHHYYQSAARQGFYWWEYDITYYVLRALQAVGIIWDVREVPAEVREANHYEVAEPKLYRIDQTAIRTAIQRAAESAKDAAHRAAEAAKEAAAYATQAYNEKTAAWAESAKEAAHRASEAASEAAAQAKGTLGIAAANAAQGARELADQWAQAARAAANALTEQPVPAFVRKK
ncbi:MAG: acyl-CoA desaturase [Bdellovibrionota bacterium]